MASSQDRERLIEEARRAQAEERWRDLLRIVKALQREDPEAARPYVEALWQHIKEERHQRQSRVEQAQSLHRMAANGHWQPVWEEVQALSREDAAAARHVARLLFVDPSYFTEEKVVDRVYRPRFWASLLRPFQVRLYRYGYGPGTLEEPWSLQVLVAATLVLVLAGLFLLGRTPAWTFLLAWLGWPLAGWGIWHYLKGRAAGSETGPLQRWGVLLASALLVALGMPWEHAPRPAMLMAVGLLYLLAGWSQAWLKAVSGWWIWGAALGMVVRRTLPGHAPLLQGLWELFAFLLVTLVAHGLVEIAQRGFWNQHRATRWYGGLLVLGYLTLVVLLTNHLLQRLG